MLVSLWAGRYIKKTVALAVVQRRFSLGPHAYLPRGEGRYVVSFECVHWLLEQDVLLCSCFFWQITMLVQSVNRFLSRVFEGNREGKL